MTSRRPGMVFQHDSQSDPWRTSYKLIECTGPSTWLVEQLPPSETIIDQVIDFYAAHEDHCGPGCTTCTYHTPVWDKTWAECDDSDPDDRPRIVGWTTCEQEMIAEVQRLQDWAGRRSTVKFISARQWAEYF